MRSGQAIVMQHATTHSHILVPPLRAGLFDGSGRIRQSSVSLLGDLLYRITGGASARAARAPAVTSVCVCAGGRCARYRHCILKLRVSGIHGQCCCFGHSVDMLWSWDLC